MDQKEYKTDFSAPCCRFQPGQEQYDAWENQADQLSEREDLDSVMALLASIVNHYETNQMDHLQCICYRKALDWMESLKQRLEKANRAYHAIHMAAVTAVTATSDGVPVHGTERPEVFAWNVGAISDDDAMAQINRGMAEFDQRIVRMTPQQSKNLFPDQNELEDDTEDAHVDQDTE